MNYAIDTLVGSESQSIRPFSSPSGNFYCVLQQDGNLCIYPKGDAINAKWQAHMNGKGGTRLLMQPDGNLVLYKGTENSVANAVWSTGTDQRKEVNFKAVMTDEGNLEVRDNNNKVIWSSKDHQ